MHADLVERGLAEPLPEYVAIVNAARYLGHGRPDLQARMPRFWTEAALLLAQAEYEAARDGAEGG